MSSGTERRKVVHCTISVQPGWLAALDAAARANGLTRSEYVRGALAERLGPFRGSAP